MNNLKFKIFSVCCLIFLISSCSEFDKINTNPDKSTEASAELIATRQIYNVFNDAGISADKNFIYDVLLAKQIGWWEGRTNELYGKLTDAPMTYQVYTNTKRMLEYAIEEDLDAYTGLSHFLRVNRVFETSLKLGDVVYSEAGMAEDGIFKPKYDTQKDVMLGLLNEIDLAYQHFSKSTRSFKGDIIYGGNITKWKKLCAALELKILIQLSKKENDPDLKIKERFAKVLNEKVLMDSNADNFQLKFENKAKMYYPFSSLQTAQQAYAMVATTIIDPLKQYDDPRLFALAEPAKALIDQGIAENDKAAYIGTDPSLSPGEMKDLQAAGMFCKLGEHFTSESDPIGEPFFRFSYAEQCFNIAEAALRGWIDKSKASEYFKKGIEAAMNFTATYTLEKHAHGNPITSADIERIKNHPELQLTGEFEKDLEKIITQKYIASFMQNSYNTYYDYRRTGYPILPINPANSLNDDGYKDKLPVRWRYRPAEYSSNRENLEEALDRQFGGQDTNNGLMWILKD